MHDARGAEARDGALVSVPAADLRRALAELELAEAAGLGCSEAVFAVRRRPTDMAVSHAAFLDVLEKSHPTDPSQNWGRDSVIRHRPGVRVVDGKVVRECPSPTPTPTPRTCNRHADCDAADASARESGWRWAEHCHDDCCDDCFGS